MSFSVNKNQSYTAKKVQNLSFGLNPKDELKIMKRAATIVAREIKTTDRVDIGDTVRILNGFQYSEKPAHRALYQDLEKLKKDRFAEDGNVYTNKAQTWNLFKPEYRPEELSSASIKDAVASRVERTVTQLAAWISGKKQLTMYQNSPIGLPGNKVGIEDLGSNPTCYGKSTYKLGKGLPQESGNSAKVNTSKARRKIFDGLMFDFREKVMFKDSNTGKYSFFANNGEL